MSLTKPTKIEINKTLVVLTVIIIAMAGLLPSLFAVELPVTKDLSEEFTKDVLKISPVLSVTVYDSDGNLKSTIIKEDDLVVNNFRNWLLALFTTGTPVTASLTNDANTAKTVNVRASSYLNSWQDSATGTALKGGFAGIGNGTTAAARTDYGLESKLESYSTPVSGFPSYSTSTGIITMSFSFSITDSYNITEAVFGCHWIASDASNNDFILFHDVFSAVSVINGDTLILGYTLTLTETGFTNNFGAMLNAVFSKISDGSEKTVSMNAEASASVYTFIVYTSRSDDYHMGFVVNYPSAANGIRIGTSSTATARTQFGCSTAVESMTSVGTPIAGTGTLVIQADIICVSAREITEAAFFLGSDEYLGNSKQSMMWRAVFAGVSVSAGKAIRITFTLTL